MWFPRASTTSADEGPGPLEWSGTIDGLEYDVSTVPGYPVMH